MPRAARDDGQVPRGRREGLGTTGVLLLMLGALECPLEVRAQAERPPVAAAQGLLRDADAAFKAEDRERARQLYQAVLKVDPDNSRAVFQLARLAPAGSPEAIALFRRYVALEPGDPWGRMALGDALSKAGASDEALREYDAAWAAAPAEEDVYTGRGRILREADRTDELVRSHEEWARRQPQSAAAWRELGRARLRAQRQLEAADAFHRSLAIAPDARTRALLEEAEAEAAVGIRPYLGYSKDSDDNRTVRGGLEVDTPLTLRSRIGLRIERNDVSDPTDSGTADELGVIALWQPLAALRLDGLAGVARLRSGQPGQGASDHPLARLRLRWRGPFGAPAADVRLAWNPLISTPALLAQPVELLEVRGRFEHPLAGPFHARVGGQYGELREPAQVNHRAGFQLGGLYRWQPAVELGLVYSQLAYDKPTTAPYFAPRRVEGFDLGLYAESEHFWPVSLALDAGFGRQQITRFGEAPREWTNATRVWTSVGWAFAPGGRLALEYEYSNSPLGSDGVTPTADWSYNAVLLTVRFGVGPGSTRPLVSGRLRENASRPQ